MTDVIGTVSQSKGSAGGWLYRHLPRPGLHAPVSATRLRAKQALVLVKGANASFDYYLAARLRALGLPYEIRDIDQDKLSDIDADGLFVIVCRYVRLRQVRWLERNRSRLAGVAYFVDDDIAALIADSHNNLDYRIYLAYFACLPITRLTGLLTHLWVSTTALAHALGSEAGVAAVLPPAPVMEDHLPPAIPLSKGSIRIVYHATNTHYREHAFLIPVMEEVIRQRPGIRFEVMARGRNRNLWACASIAQGNILILPPMGWRDYYKYSCDHDADIALMPLLDSLANNSRADTKLIDCCRLGAAAVLSDVAPYRHHRGGDGLLVSNSAESWIEALLELIDHPDRLNKVKQATRNHVLAMTLAEQPFPGIESRTIGGVLP